MQHQLVVRPPTSFLQLLSNDLRWKIIAALARSDHHVKELVALVGEQPNLVSYHLRRLRDRQLVTEHRSSADRRDVYYSLDLDVLRQMYLATGDALHPAMNEDKAEERLETQPSTARPIRVLFLCTANSARSQMAEGIMRRLAGDRVDVSSAGSQPSVIHPEAVRVLAELGVDASAYRSKQLDEYSDQTFEYIITVCDRVRETCPVFPGDPQRIHWSFSDPAIVEDDDARRKAFDQTARELTTRIRHVLIVIEREQCR